MISIIVPIYNIESKEKHFKIMIQSLKKQTETNIEIILVNDGSTDKSRELLKVQENSDCRIKVFCKENGGVESARRYGMEKCCGKYIFHMDQDDYLKKNALELMKKEMESSKADIVVANSKRVLGKLQKKNIPECMEKRKEIEHSEFMQEFFISFFGINKMPINIWGKLYRKSFLEKIPIPPITGLIIEDLSYNMHVFPYAEKIVLIPNVLYNYRWGGYTCKFDKTILETAFFGYRLKNAILKKYGCQQYEIFVSIELMNYIKTYFIQEIIYNNIDNTELLKKITKIYASTEVKASVEKIKEYDEWNTEYKKQIITNNIQSMIMSLKKEAKKLNRKQKIKRVLSKLIG